MVKGSLDIKTLNSNNVNIVTPEITYDLKYITPTKFTNAIDLSNITTTDVFYNIDILPHQNISKIQLLTKDLLYNKLPMVNIKLNGNEIMSTLLDAVNSCSFMLDSTKIETLQLKLDNLSDGMLYIIYDHTLLPDVSNTTLTPV